MGFVGKNIIYHSIRSACWNGSSGSPFSNALYFFGIRLRKWNHIIEYRTQYGVIWHLSDTGSKHICRNIVHHRINIGTRKTFG